MKIELSAEETGYVLGLLKEHLEYYRLLAGNEFCSAVHRAKREFLEGLWMKLARARAAQSG
jgi:hypothetical protein